MRMGATGPTSSPSPDPPAQSAMEVRMLLVIRPIRKVYFVTRGGEE